MRDVAMNGYRHPLRTASVAALCLLSLSGFLATVPGWAGLVQAAGIAYIRPPAAKERIERIPGLVVLDVRTPEEYAAGHLANSVLLPVAQVEAQAITVLKDRYASVLIYCHSGGRSETAAKTLMAQGYANVMSMVGGIVAWSAAGYPVVK